ncbi:RNA-directed DNA polymerase, eukaryota [Tanacetum coccineum]
MESYLLLPHVIEKASDGGGRAMVLTKKGLRVIGTEGDFERIMSLRRQWHNDAKAIATYVATLRLQMVDGIWIDSPCLVKSEFLSHFTNRFDQPKDCEADKSPGPDWFTFGFCHRYWNFLEKDVEEAIYYFSSMRRSLKENKKQTMIFKVDFEKACDSLRWDYLDDGDPLSAFLFILIIESLHISVQRVVDAGMFRGISMGPSLHLSHLFYVDDVVFMGHWSDSNIDNIVQVLECFYRVSGLRINMNKSKLMRISVANVIVDQAAAKIGCAMLEAPFSYLGSKVGGLMSRVPSWNEIVNNLVARLSN